MQHTTAAIDRPDDLGLICGNKRFAQPVQPLPVLQAPTPIGASLLLRQIGVLGNSFLSPCMYNVMYLQRVRRRIGDEYMAKVDKVKFDALLKRVIAAKPVPRTSIKATGKRGPKTPILAK